MSTSSRKEREKRPLLLNDGEGGAPPPYVGVGEMDRPFGTSSMRYWALFVFVALSVTQNIVRACAFSSHPLTVYLHHCSAAAHWCRKIKPGSLCSVYLLSPIDVPRVLTPLMCCYTDFCSSTSHCIFLILTGMDSIQHHSGCCREALRHYSSTDK